MTASARIEHDDFARDITLLEFPSPMLGFPGVRAYALEAVEPTGTLLRLTGISPSGAPVEGAQFIVVPAAYYFPDYAPLVPDADVEAIGAASPLDIVCLVVLNLNTTDPAASVANLRAPVLYNTGTLLGIQSITEDDWPLRAPIGG